MKSRKDQEELKIKNEQLKESRDATRKAERTYNEEGQGKTEKRVLVGQSWTHGNNSRVSAQV